MMARRLSAREPFVPSAVSGKSETHRSFGRKVMQQGSGDERVRARAYELWEKDGRPEGREMDYWLKAEEELNATPRQEEGGETAPPVAPETEGVSNIDQPAEVPAARKKRTSTRGTNSPGG